MSRYLAITGGVGGAKLGLGLARVLTPEQLTFAVNTGDDFDHLGLHIETWDFMDALDGLGGETWFRLGDRDLALHVTRTQLMSAGASLTEATDHICQALGVAHRVLPMSNDPVRTTVHTDRGPLPFQHYFVRERCEPAVTGFDFAGIGHARLNPAIQTALDDLRGIIICPSNPFVSIDPMLNLPGARAALKETGVPIVAVSPIVGGTAIKGPTAKMMRELDVPATAAQVAEHYGDLLTGMVLDQQDEHLDGTLGTPTIVAQTVMVSLQDRVDLGRTVVDFIEKLG